MQFVWTYHIPLAAHTEPAIVGVVTEGHYFVCFLHLNLSMPPPTRCNNQYIDEYVGFTGDARPNPRHGQNNAH